MAKLSNREQMAEREDPKWREADLASKPTSQQEASFFGLPAELRNQIYFEVLVDGEIAVHCAQIHSRTSLLRVCSQFHSEALQIFWTKNIFTISNTQDQMPQLEKFLRGAGRRGLRLLKELLFRPQRPNRIAETFQILTNVRRRGGSTAEAKAELEAKFGPQDANDDNSILRHFIKEEYRCAHALATTCLQSGIAEQKAQAEVIAKLHIIAQSTQAEIFDNSFKRAVCERFE